MNTALTTSVTDKDLAKAWDADRRLAALVTFGSGVVAGVGVVLAMSVLPGGVAADTTSDSDVVLGTAWMLAVDIAVLVFMVGLAHVVASTRAFGEAVTIAVATLTTAIAATLHTVYGLTGSSTHADLPDWFTDHVAWLGRYIWLQQLYALPIGACLLALSLALRSSEFRFARRLAGPYAAVGGLSCVLAPVGVLAIFTTCVAVPALFVLTLVLVGRLLWMTRTPRRHESDALA